MACVLVVEDDSDLREVIAILIAEAGADCISCGSLAEVQAELDAVLTCHLAILDVNLGPEQPSGVDVFHWLRAHGFRGDIIFLTGHGSTDPRVIEAANLPGAQLLSKPIGAAKLVQLASQP
ncbi:MAG TPA: response regulator [Kofleriaceae bacterium]|nr:response regulator [Kofleriaceae bacterium]